MYTSYNSCVMYKSYNCCVMNTSYNSCLVYGNYNSCVMYTSNNSCVIYGYASYNFCVMYTSYNYCVRYIVQLLCIPVTTVVFDLFSVVPYTSHQVQNYDKSSIKHQLCPHSALWCQLLPPFTGTWTEYNPDIATSWPGQAKGDS